MQRRLIALGLLLTAFVAALLIAVLLTVRAPAPDTKAGAPPPQAAPSPGGKNEGIGVLVPPKQ